MEKELKEFDDLLKAHVDALDLPPGGTISKMTERVKYFGEQMSTFGDLVNTHGIAIQEKLQKENPGIRQAILEIAETHKNAMVRKMKGE